MKISSGVVPKGAMRLPPHAHAQTQARAHARAHAYAWYAHFLKVTGGSPSSHNLTQPLTHFELCEDEDHALDSRDTQSASPPGRMLLILSCRYLDHIIAVRQVAAVVVPTVGVSRKIAAKALPCGQLHKNKTMGGVHGQHLRLNNSMLLNTCF